MCPDKALGIQDQAAVLFNRFDDVFHTVTPLNVSIDFIIYPFSLSVNTILGTRGKAYTDGLRADRHLCFLVRYCKKISILVI
jgi:hypothetical protein